MAWVIPRVSDARPVPAPVQVGHPASRGLLHYGFYGSPTGWGNIRVRVDKPKVPVAVATLPCSFSLAPDPALARVAGGR
jgi:hypothetical protein